MKKFIITLSALLIFILCVVGNVNAQTKYHENTTWHCGFLQESPYIHTRHLAKTLTIEGDTIIDGEYFQRIVKSQSLLWDNMQTPFSVEYVKKENSVVC